jgi:geranylgeranyl pyrophosphate synthase
MTNKKYNNNSTDSSSSKKQKNYFKPNDFYFDKPQITQKENEFHQLINQQFMKSLKKMPEVLINPAVTYLMRYAIDVKDPMNFFHYFYSTSWSIIPSIINTFPLKEAGRILYEEAAAGQAMAMMLHVLDNHLVDSQEKTTHLLLQIRSTAWNRFEESLHFFSKDIVNGDKHVQNVLNNYFTNVEYRKQPESLDEYLEFTILEGGTWILLPFLISLKLQSNKEIAKNVLNIQNSFIKAFRILDDIQDTFEDAQKSKVTSVTLMLPENKLPLWSSCKGISECDSSQFNDLLEFINDSGIYRTLVQKIQIEIDIGINIAQEIGLHDYANQLKQMTQSLGKLYAE